MDNMLEKYAKKAYLYSSEEEYLLSLMDKFAGLYDKEMDDKNLEIVYNNAQDHDGNKMVWYTKAVIADNTVVNAGDEIRVKKADGDIVGAEIISINDKGAYFKFADSGGDHIAFGVVSPKGEFIYDVIGSSGDMDVEDEISYYIIPQYEDVDLNYKEKLSGNNLDVIKKRARFILNKLDNVFPTTIWSIRIIRGDGEEVEVIEQNEH